MIVRPASRMLRAISFGRLLPLGALDERDHAVEERLARLRGDAHDDLVRQHARPAGDGRAVAARLADDRCRLAGDGRLVDRRDALDRCRRRRGSARRRRTTHSSPTASSAPTPSRSWCRRVGGRARRVSARVLRSVSAWALPRPSATASAKLANSTVNHSQAATSPANTLSAAVADGSFWKNRTVVRTLPISTTNITGLRAMTAGRASRTSRRPRAARSRGRTSSVAGTSADLRRPRGRVGSDGFGNGSVTAGSSELSDECSTTGPRATTGK